MNLLEMHRAKARPLKKTICLPESAADVRTMKAAAMFLKEQLGTPLLIGSADKLAATAQAAGVSLDGMKCLDVDRFDRLEEMIAAYQARRARDNMTNEQVRELLHDPIWFGAMLVNMGIADGMTGGAINTTANVMRAAIKCVGPRPGIKTVSAAFLMVWPEGSPHAQRPLLYADSALNIAPTDEQLVDIGEAAADAYRQIVGIEPVLAYLSFSTKGSADHENARRMARAAANLAARRPDLKVDGEMQFDAAFLPAIAASKCPGSPSGGKANVMIFPDLSAGNIAYKITQRLGGAAAIGTVTMGLAKPINDLSRGCSSEDIVQVATITALQTQK